MIHDFFQKKSLCLTCTSKRFLRWYMILSKKQVYVLLVGVHVLWDDTWFYSKTQVYVWLVTKKVMSQTKITYIIGCMIYRSTVLK